MRDHFASKGFAKFAADQVYNWVYRQFNFDPLSWSNISKKLKEYIYSEMDFSLPEVVTVQQSVDGTKKLLLKLFDDELVETVLIPSQDRRVTICISSQVGCKLKCKFCCTGTLGFTRDLTCGEIVGQYLVATKYSSEFDIKNESGPPISNLVFMGQGEPLLNFDNTKSAAHIFLEPKGLGLGQRRVTVSTAGIVPMIEKMSEFPPINLAISLHSPFNDIRNTLMPINKTYPVEVLIAAAKRVELKAHRYVTYEYLLISDLTDRSEDILKLVDLLDRDTSKINLIPFNEYDGSKFRRPSDEKIDWFKKELLARGYLCTLRQSKGMDIAAACGQLKSQSTS